MLKGTTQSGFKFTVVEENLDDMELIELLAGVDENALLLPKLLTKILGEKQKKRLYDHCRNEKGVVPSEAVSKELISIFDRVKALKNS